MFCAYNDYLHITAKTLPSYRIKDGSDIASSTCRNPRYCSLIFVVRTDKGRTINSASGICQIGNSVCKFYFSANRTANGIANRDGYNYLCTNTVVYDILFADFYFQSIIQLFNDSLPFTAPFC